MQRSSSGPGRQVFILNIASSNLARCTIIKLGIKSYELRVAELVEAIYV